MTNRRYIILPFSLPRALIIFDLMTKRVSDTGFFTLLNSLISTNLITNSMWVTRQSFFTRKHLFGVQQGVSDLNMFPLPYFSHDQQYVSDNWSDFFHRIFHVMTNRMWVMLHFFFDILSHSMANSMWVMLLCSARNFHAFHSFIIRLWGTSDFSLNWSLITSDPHDQQRVSVTASFSFPGLCAMTNRMWVTLYFFFSKQCYHISWLAGCESWFCYQEPYSFSAYNNRLWVTVCT
jgi:hypothetical protein